MFSLDEDIFLSNKINLVSINLDPMKEICAVDFMGYEKYYPNPNPSNEFEIKYSIRDGHFLKFRLKSIYRRFTDHSIEFIGTHIIELSFGNLGDYYAEIKDRTGYTCKYTPSIKTDYTTFMNNCNSLLEKESEFKYIISILNLYVETYIGENHNGLDWNPLCLEQYFYDNKNLIDRKCKMKEKLEAIKEDFK